MRLFLCGLLGMAIFSCAESQDPKLGEEFDLAYGQFTQIHAEDISIKFLDVAGDSRCPTGVVCVWEGNAEIILLVNSDTLSINTTLEPKIIDYKPYTVELISVLPYPKWNEQIALEDYLIRLMVTR